MLNNEPLGAARRSMTAQDVLSIGSMRVGITRNPQAASAMPAGDLEPVSEPEAAWLGRLRTLLDGATSRSVVLVVAALWIGALMGAVGYAFASWSGHLPWQPESALTQAHRLQQRLRAYPELSVTPRNDGVVVSGYVNDGTARDQVAQIVTSTDRAALDNVYVVTDLVATAQTYFSDTALTVKYMGRGRIELTGTAERAKIEPRIRNYMKDARPALELVDHVRDAQLNAPRSATLGGTDGIPEITTVFASNGDRRYIETVDGTRYFEGAKLKDGPTLVSIDSEQIIFEQNGRRITIPLGGVKPPQVLPATRNG
jgi:type III secretion system YscD/HrpQ family protein